ncbi:cytochrome P450 family protein [Rhizoctonia solani]|uniref:Cytochrome P450 family protein n=1 Tax=Rhizoctonia solani TaxID=456999 RepID=A0A8H8NNL8_9AGAM|nr:cytochrome P450 family protein [Rhizoctonia solani]QRW15563.1 cytochrome P450 family protein [Rhizoctonia solani]
MFAETTQHSNAYYCAAAAALLMIYYVAPYLLDPHDYRRRFSGPWLASLSGSWLARSASSGRHYQNLLQIHEKYGRFVRVGPNHISISDPDALEEVYGHSNGLLKSEFYDAFVNNNGDRNIFDIRDKAIHTMKRKRIANIFSPQNVVAFEPRVRVHIQRFCDQLDMRCHEATIGTSGFNWTAKDGRAVLNSCPQFAYLTFDLISDLALGVPFGMVEAQKDSTPTLLSLTSKKNIKGVTPIRLVAVSGQGGMTLGSYPSWAQKLLPYAPWHLSKLIAFENFGSSTQAAVEASIRRKENEEEGENKRGVDLLDKLFEVKNADGSPLERAEIDAEAAVTLAAGSDTTANSLSALSYYIASNPEIKKKLQQELDSIDMDLAEANDLEENKFGCVIPSFEQVKNLPYLNACIKETLRLYSTVGSGLPRVVPEGKTLTVAGQTFNAGSVVSVPSYCTNRSSVWGPDAEMYRPERWLEEGASSLNKYFAAFSSGPRGCVGRNLANLNLLLVSSTFFRRYDIELASPTTKFQTTEGFVRDATHCEVAIKRRVLTL